MKKIITLFFLSLVPFQAFANVHHIDITKISNDNKLVNAFNFIKDNTEYYDHWSSKWSYDKSKEDLKQQLREHFKKFSVLTTKNQETYLLLGDIAHYLYNLDDTAYHDIAVTNYNAAIKSNPGEYRSHWFLGYHYALSNAPNSAIDNFLKAEKLLPQQQPADFWNDYACATGLANMPSHSIYAMDKVKSISGKEGSFQQQLGKAIHKRIIPIDKNEFHDKSEIWKAIEGDKVTFTSRPLGIKIAVDSIWKLEIYDYQKSQGAFIMNPPSIKNKKGKEINYTIAILMKTVEDGDNLSDHTSKFVSDYPDKKQISFSDKYGKMIAYEIKDKSTYQDIGGAHLYMIGIERNAPEYPGLLLENPETLPKGKSGEVTYYAATESKDRFKGKIFYVIMLDTCEDIHDQSLKIFKSLFDNQITIE